MLHQRKGLDVGSHIDGFFPFLIGPERWPDFPDLLFWNEEAPGDAVLPVVDREPPTIAQDAMPKMAIHIHAFYLHGLEEMRKAIECNSAKPAIYLTGPAENKDGALAVFSSYSGAVSFRAFPNIGRDIVPFLQLIPEISADGADLIAHLHVKKSAERNTEAYVRRWTDYLLSSLIGHPARGIASIDHIAADWNARSRQPALYLPHIMDRVGWTGNRPIAEGIYREFFGGPALPDRIIFGVGSMFWATADYLQEFGTISLPWHQVAAEPLPGDPTVLHTIERLFGAVAMARGQQIVIAPHNQAPFAFSEPVVEMVERHS